MAVVLAFAKQLPAVLEHQRHAHWAQNEFVGLHLPWLLRGRTLGLIGVGTIGVEIAARAKAFGMRVVAVRRRIVPDEINTSTTRSVRNNWARCSGSATSWWWRRR